jgi:Xaa-Pro aminopeptidase
MTDLLRVDKLRASLANNKLDAFLSFNPFNQRWLTGWQQVFDTESAHAALITPDSALIHTDGRYSGAMREHADNQWIINDQHINHALFVNQHFKDQQQPIRLGIEDNLPLDRYRALKKVLASNIQLVETSAVILKLRAFKDNDELELHREAQRITDKAFAQLIEWIKPGLTELEVANHLEFTMRDLGAQGLAFSSIVASGPNSAKPHAVPSTRQLSNGDFVVLDFGARYLDYCADMTRTICIGKPSAKQLDIYQSVLEAHNQVKDAIKDGVTGAEMHNLAVSVLAERGYEKEFIHSLGHGVGIEVHELPVLSPNNQNALRSGNVVTDEPGVYLQGVGGVRIEDTGLVTTDGLESFALSTKELIAI